MNGQRYKERVSKRFDGGCGRPNAEGASPIAPPVAKVLVVDPSRVAREMVVDCLVDAGFRVATAAGPVEVSESDRRSAGLWILGGETRHEAATDILRRWRCEQTTALTPAVVMVGGEANEAALEILGDHRNDCLFMPLDTRELLVRVSAVLCRTASASDRSIRMTAGGDRGNDSTLPSGAVANDEVDPDDTFRRRVTAAFDDPIRQTLGLAEHLERGWVTSDAVASLVVVRSFLGATQRLLSPRQVRAPGPQVIDLNRRIEGAAAGIARHHLDTVFEGKGARMISSRCP